MASEIGCQYNKQYGFVCVNLHWFDWNSNANRLVSLILIEMNHVFWTLLFNVEFSRNLSLFPFHAEQKF